MKRDQARNGMDSSRSGSRVDFWPTSFAARAETLGEFRYKVFP